MASKIPEDKTANTGTTSDEVASAVSIEFQNFVADVETLLKSLTSLTGAELDAAKAQFYEKLAAAKLKLEEVRVSLKKQAYDTIAYTDAYVHEQPWKAVGASAAFGFLLGLLCARRH